MRPPHRLPSLLSSSPLYAEGCRIVRTPPCTLLPPPPLACLRQFRLFMSPEAACNAITSPVACQWEVISPDGKYHHIPYCLSRGITSICTRGLISCHHRGVYRIPPPLATSPAYCKPEVDHPGYYTPSPTVLFTLNVLVRLTLILQQGLFSNYIFQLDCTAL